MSLSPERPQSHSGIRSPRHVSAGGSPTARPPVSGSLVPPPPACELQDTSKNGSHAMRAQLNGASTNGTDSSASLPVNKAAGAAHVPAPHARPAAEGTRPAVACNGAKSGPWLLNELFPSCTETARRLLDSIMQQLQAEAWNDSDRFAVHLALEEGLMNAIKHGNKYDRNKHVHVRCSTTRERFEIEIEDEGSGFEPQDVPDCTDDDNLEACSGRGIALIRCFMSQVEYQNHGRRLVMVKLPTE